MVSFTGIPTTQALCATTLSYTLQQDLLSASDVAEARNNGAANRRPAGDESLVLWNGILKIALGVVAGLFLLVCVVRIGNTIKRSRRRRRKAAAKQKRRR